MIRRFSSSRVTNAGKIESFFGRGYYWGIVEKGVLCDTGTLVQSEDHG